MKNQIHNEDCTFTMDRMPDNYIDLTVTSPPYDHLRDYNGYSFDFEVIAHELYRVTKEGGVLVWIVGDATVNGSETGTSFRQALYFMECGFKLWDTMIYRKARVLPQQQHKRYNPCFEYMFIFSKGYPKTFNPIMVDNKHAGKIVTTSGQRESHNGFRHDTPKKVTVNEQKFKHNIWEYSNQAIKGHPAVFPEQLALDHILTWSNKDDLVYDPFMGSGTTAKMCIQSGRNYIGSEISKEYCDIATKRLLTLTTN